MVIGHRQVLDGRAQAPEGVSHEVLTQDATTGDTEMFDHGAMGTLIIGLNAVEDETNTKRVHRPVAAPRRERSIRAALARGLRRGADLLQPQTVGELAK
jgi:hypothetical protein